MLGEHTTPDEWISKDGLPAKCLGDPTKGFGGFPSYYRDQDDFVVHEFLVCFNAGSPMMFPRMYGTVAAVSTEGLVMIRPQGPEEWRPFVYQKDWLFEWFAMGSQMEVAWRAGLANIQGFDNGEIDVENILKALEMEAAEEKADRLLEEMLNPFQRLEYAATNQFKVRGARTGNLYSVSLGDGFNLVDKKTHEVVMSYCFHPEYYVPAADTALATKFCLEDSELEVQVLEEARGNPRDGSDEPPTEDQLKAFELEKELIV